MVKKTAFHTALYLQLILSLITAVITAAVSGIQSTAVSAIIHFVLRLICGALPYLIMLPYSRHFKTSFSLSIIASALCIPQRLIGEKIPYSIILTAVSAALSCFILYFFIKGADEYFETARQASAKHKKAKNAPKASFKSSEAEKLSSRWKRLLTVLIIFDIIVTLLSLLINLLPASVPKEPLSLFAGIFGIGSLILTVYRLWLTFKTAVLAQRAHALQTA